MERAGRKKWDWMGRQNFGYGRVTRGLIGVCKIGSPDEFGREDE